MPDTRLSTSPERGLGLFGQPSMAPGPSYLGQPRRGSAGSEWSHGTCTLGAVVGKWELREALSRAAPKPTSCSGHQYWRVDKGQTTDKEQEKMIHGQDCWIPWHMGQLLFPWTERRWGENGMRASKNLTESSLKGCEWKKASISL